ncbi:MULTISPECIES: ArnT family glycosyltransferase [unclassified Luteococcus]|uniref:ArnT family glycosyltransferase n=1 Tax=unclassified Luteococcus TaxID=2639923 RepID=UPI00313C804B
MDHPHQGALPAHLGELDAQFQRLVGTEAGTGAHTASGTPAERGRLARFLLGSRRDPAWARPALWALLALSAVVYLWNLTISGYANDFYAAAVKSGTQSWTAWLFGSLDSANAITVDKPPASLWVMGLSARIFGFSSFSLLLPQALMGVGTVATVAAAVRRWHGHLAGLVAGALVLATPVAALMFHFDNPDAMLTLLMSLAGYLVVRALDSSTVADAGSTVSERGATLAEPAEATSRTSHAALGWMIAAGAAIGFAFLTKMLQGLLVLPGFVLAYFLASRHNLKTRTGHLLAALVSMIVSAGWFIALVSLWPAAKRAYIGGSTNNTLWELALGYNGLGRIVGGSGNGGGGGGGGGFGGTAGIFRMFNSQFGTEISWFLPAALILLVAGLVARGRAPRTDRARTSLVIWGGWLLSTALVLSFMEGTVHSYYAVALTPGIAATIAVAGLEVFRKGRRDGVLGVAWRTVLGLAVAVTAGWGSHLLALNASGWHSWVRYVALVGGIAGAMAYVALGVAKDNATLKKLAVGALLVGSLSAAAPSVAWTVGTVNVAHTGSMPASGPAVAGGQMGMGGGGQMGGTPPTGTDGAQSGSTQSGTSSTSQSGTSQQGTTPTGNPPAAPSGTSQSGAAQSGTAQSGTTQSGTTAGTGTTSGTGASTGTTQQARNDGARAGGPGGSASANSELVALLNQTSSKWSAAVIGDQTAAGYILNSDTAVMSIGGWSGTDNNVTLEQFKAYVANADITYFISGGGMVGGPGGKSGPASEISEWVAANFTSTTVGGATVYHLTSAS